MLCFVLFFSFPCLKPTVDPKRTLCFAFGNFFGNSVHNAAISCLKHCSVFLSTFMPFCAARCMGVCFFMDRASTAAPYFTTRCSASSLYPRTQLWTLTIIVSIIDIPSEYAIDNRIVDNVKVLLKNLTGTKHSCKTCFTFRGALLYQWNIQYLCTLLVCNRVCKFHLL